MKKQMNLTEANKGNEVQSFVSLVRRGPGEGGFVTFRRTYSVLSLLRLFAAILGFALADSAQAQFTWTTNADNTITITGYTGPGGDVSIPATLTGLPVTSIGGLAFTHCFSLTQVAIPSGVTNIAGAAFSYCQNLASIAVPNNVVSIGDYAFYNCSSLTNVIFGSSVSSIGENTFAECTTLTSVYFKGNPLGFVGAGAFFDAGIYSSSLTYYYLPGAVGWRPSSYVVLWNPLIQTGDGSFGVQNGQFGFNITGTPDIPIAVEASTSLANPVWTPLATMTLTNGSVYFSEPLQTNTPGRFYRIGSP